jgi:hypothetical protein
MTTMLVLHVGLKLSLNLLRLDTNLTPRTKQRGKKSSSRVVIGGHIEHIHIIGNLNLTEMRKIVEF